MTTCPEERKIRYISPDRMAGEIGSFDRKNSVTRGEFGMDVPGLLADMEWNHMDQLHRQFIHNTYQANLRMALGQDFALSLTRWGRWPVLITVADARVAEGIFYQNMVLGGLIFVHNTISMREADEVVSLKIEWIITSHRFLKPLHGILSRMFYRLNTRLQVEDAVIRSQRYTLRKHGYAFRSDPPDFFSSNKLAFNTLYPALAVQADIDLSAVPLGANTVCKAGGLEFIVRREADEIQIWPAVCPHEGAELIKGKPSGDCRIECPWHGLKIRAARLSKSKPTAEAYGFRYTLNGNSVLVAKGESDDSVEV